MNSLANLNQYYIPNTLDGINSISQEVTSNALLVDGSNKMLADLDMNSHQIKNVANATLSNEAVNLGQLNSTLLNFVDLTSNQTIGGTKTFSTQVIFNGTTKTNLTLDDIPNTANRVALSTSGTQTIAGTKVWSNSASFNGPTFTTSGTNVNINSTNFNINATTITNLNNGANCNNKKLTNVLDPTNAQDVATKNYVDSLTLDNIPDTSSRVAVKTSGTQTFTGYKHFSDVVSVYGPSFSVGNLTETNLLNGANCNNKKLTNVANPTNAQDVATKNYVDTIDTNIRSDVNTALNLKVNKAGDTMTGDLVVLANVGINNSTPTERLDVNGNGVFNYPSSSTNIERQLSLRVNGNSNDGLFFHNNLSAGSWNSLVGTNDKAIIFSDGSSGTGKLVIGHWGNYGMKLDCENGSMTLNSKQTINKNATTFTNFDVNSTQLIDIKSGNPLYERYTLTYNGLGSQIRVPYNTQADTTLVNKTIAFKITGSTQIFLEPLPLTGAFTTIFVDGVSYVSTSYTISSSILLKGTGTVGHYTTHPYQEYIAEDQLTIATNLYTDANDEFAGIRFAGSGTELGFIRVDTNRTKTDANMSFYIRQANAITTPLTINNTIVANIPILCNGGTIDYNSGTIDSGNRTNTYIGFAPAGSNNDWALLRQIGGDNDYHMALDIHDDAFDGKVSFRNVESTASPDNIRTFFKATATRGFYNPISTAVRITDANNYELDNNPGVTTIYCYGGQCGPIYLPNTRDIGMRIEVINLTSQNQNVNSGIPGILTSLIKNGATTTTTTTVLNNGWYAVFIWTGGSWVGHRFGGVGTL